MAASYLIQGAFKETMEALFVLAFALGLHELAGGSLGGRDPAPRWRLLAGVPLAALAVGSVYAYSFPGLTWIIGALAAWILLELVAPRASVAFSTVRGENATHASLRRMSPRRGWPVMSTGSSRSPSSAVVVSAIVRSRQGTAPAGCIACTRASTRWATVH